MGGWIKASKASGPDGISPKIIKEFAYEFSTPICDILNSSYAEGVVPTQWKKAIVVPIPKTNLPKCDKLRPVSLSDCFAKVAETFITDWILEDISDRIDLQQYGNVKGVSTSHYLVSLLHFLHQGADKSQQCGFLRTSRKLSIWSTITCWLKNLFTSESEDPSSLGCVTFSATVCSVLDILVFSVHNV